MKFEIFFVTSLHLLSLVKSLPSFTSPDIAKLPKYFKNRDLTYDLSFGWFGANEEDGEKLNPDIKIASQIHDGEKTETVQNLLLALEKQAKNADNEQQKYILNLLQDFNKVLIKTPARYSKILLNNVWHTVDMGAFGTTQRLREVMTAESFIDKLKQLLWQIVQLFYDYLSQEMIKSNSKTPGSSGYSSGTESSENGSGEILNVKPSKSPANSGRSDSAYSSTDKTQLPESTLRYGHRGSMQSGNSDSKESSSSEGSIGSGSSESKGSVESSSTQTATEQSPGTSKESQEGITSENSSIRNSAEGSSEISHKTESSDASGQETSANSSSKESPDGGATKESNQSYDSAPPSGNGSPESMETSTRDIPSQESSSDEKQSLEKSTRRSSEQSGKTNEEISDISASSTEPSLKESEKFNMGPASVNTNRPCPPSVRISP